MKLLASTSVLAAVIAGATACSGGGHGAAPAPPSSSTSAPDSGTTLPSASSTTAPPPPSPPTTTSLLGLVVTGQGATLTPPSAPTVKPYNQNCGSLVDTGFTGQCVVITAASGTIAGLTEVQQSQGSAAPLQERDLVYRRSADGWSLALRRVETVNPSTGTGQSTLWESDVERDGDPKAVFVTPANNSQYGEELDVVEASGSVILFRQLHGGFATIAQGGGLETFVPNSTNGYDEAVIRYVGGAWRIVSLSTVSQTQAQAEGNGPFTDPQGHQAQYVS